MIDLSEEAKRLTSTFLAYRNDIDIYTEDEVKDKEFYKVLFKRLIKSDIVINDITPLGSKSNVINRCKDEPNNGRKKIFIVDGDVAIVHGNNIPAMNNLFVLDAYCIENYLFDKESLIHFVYLSCAIKAKEDIEKEIDFNNWINEYSESLIELFIHFALADLFGINFTLYNVAKYHEGDKNAYQFSPQLVLKEVASVKSDILKSVSNSDYLAKHAQLSKKWSNSFDTFSTIISGKDYLIPILLIKTRKFKKSQSLPSLEEVKMHLIQFCKLDRLDRLKVAIEAL